MELHELHVFDQSFGTINHGYTVARSYLRISRGSIDRSRSAGSHQGDTTQIGINLLCLGIEDIGTVALDIRSAACDAYS